MIKPKLLFIKHKDFNARTVENDEIILNKEYNVKMYDVNTTKTFSFFFALIFQFYFLLFCIHKYKIIYIWFADYHSLLPVFFSRLFKKKCVINIGGYDADEILIGNSKSLKEKFRKFCVLYSVKNASMLLPVSNVLKKYLATAVNESKCETIYCCVNTDKFPVENVTFEKDNLVITVGGGGQFLKEAQRKRLDFFIELGNEFSLKYPEYNAQFLAIGHEKKSVTFKYLSELVKSENVEIKPLTKSVAELLEYYSKASIYMQLSYYEAFGIAQIEAMLNGCIPVSNDGGAICEVVGDAGFIIKDYDMNEYMKIIKEIFDKKHEGLRLQAKQRVLDNFTLQARAKKLLPLLHKLFAQ